jgi:hypothetical protein
MGFLPIVPPGTLSTIDPWVVMEAQRPGYVRYRGLDDGRRWEVHGTCAWTDAETDGPCQEGQRSLPIGPPDGRLDCPVTPELDCSLCVGEGHLTFTELARSADPRQADGWVAAENERLAGRVRVVVPAIDDHPIALRALLTEGIRPEVVRCDQDDLAYARLLTDLWHRGESFCLVEHDVVPWPGAVSLLFTCPEPWCGYLYAGVAAGGLGCVRFAAGLLATDLSPAWEGTHWSDLDGLVTRTIGEHLRRPGYHRHTPDVAHASRESV